MERKRLHNTETRGQIILPAVLLILLIIGFAVLMGYLGMNDPETMKKIANYFIAVAMLCLTLVNIGLFFLAVHIAMVVNGWGKIIPGYSDRANEQVDRILPKVDAFLNGVVIPFIQSESYWNALKKALFRKES